MCKFCTIRKDTSYPEKAIYDNGIVEININYLSNLEINEYNSPAKDLRDSLAFDFKINYCPICGRKL